MDKVKRLEESVEAQAKAINGLVPALLEKAFNGGL
jgi:hypothetical protein